MAQLTYVKQLASKDDTICLRLVGHNTSTVGKAA
jgi:hypothetical protein